MQSNVIKITAIAMQSGLFNHIGSTSFSDLSEFPALIVGKRHKKLPETMSAMHTRNKETWNYEVIIIMRNDSDQSEDDNWLSMEAITNDIKARLVGTPGQPGEFFLGEEHQDEALISGQECLMAVIDVEIDLRVQYP